MECSRFGYCPQQFQKDPTPGGLSLKTQTIGVTVAGAVIPTPINQLFQADVE